MMKVVIVMVIQVQRQVIFCSLNTVMSDDDSFAFFLVFKIPDQWSKAIRLPLFIYKESLQLDLFAVHLFQFPDVDIHRQLIIMSSKRDQNTVSNQIQKFLFHFGRRHCTCLFEHPLPFV